MDVNTFVSISVRTPFQLEFVNDRMLIESGPEIVGADYAFLLIDGKLFKS